MDSDRKPNRLQKWDYSSCGYYFITICSHDRSNIFGEMAEGKIVLNGLGLLAEKCWRCIPDHFDGVELEEFVVMPNHVHGILKIKWRGRIGRGRIYASRTRDETGEKYDRSKMLLPRIIQNFKAGVSKESGKGRIWQRSYFDEVIRTEESLQKIQWYIRNNPKLWYRDRNNKG